MAQHYNPRISNAADLIFYLDAVNTKSYPGSGSTWYDVSGNNNHFTLFNTPTYTQNGTIGTYLTFNGTNQYARSNNAINFNNYSAVTLEIGYRTTVTNATQILYETTGTGVSTATGGITLLMNANSTSTVADTYLSQWQGYGPRLFGFTPTTNTSFNSVAETFVNGVDSTGRQALINGTTAQFFTNTAVTVLTSATTNNMNGVDILVIGGGGAGGHLGGGGAGGHQYFTNQSLVANTNYTVTVGAGGTASTGATGNTGSNSVFNIYTSAGGGGGAGEAALPTTGGSGGGGGGVAGTSRPGAAGNTPSTSPSQGNTGGNGNDNGAGTAFAGGGGGGAGGTGNNASGTTTAGNGGLGTANSITGSSVTRAAGGGGGAYQLGGTGTAGTGGSSIGGNGGRNGLNATGGSPNTGSGGGGNGYTDAGNLQGSSGAGGSGVVIIKYSNSVTISNPGGGLTFTTDSSSVAGYNITTFTAGTGQISFNETRFANTWTYVASRAGTGNFFRGDIAYVRAWGRKLATSDLGNNVSVGIARQPLSYQAVTLITTDPSQGVARIRLLSGTTYDATGCGAVASIDALTTEPLYSILPTSGFLKYIIAKSTGNQTITVAYIRSGATISQSAFSTLGLSVSYSTAISSILVYSIDDHDSLFMDADGRGVISRNQASAFYIGTWDKFQGTTEVTTNAALDSVVLYPASSFVGLGNATIVSFPKTTSGVWINLTAGTYKVNNLSSQTMPAAMSTALGTASPTNSMYTISDGVNQFIVGRWTGASAALCTVDLTTGIISATAITYTVAPSQTNTTEEDCVGTQLFAVDGSISFLSNTIFYHGGTRPWKDVTGSPVSTSGKTTFTAGTNDTQTDMDIFGSIDASDRYVWFADWGHDNGGLFNVGNDSQLGVRKTNIIHISDSYTN